MDTFFIKAVLSVLSDSTRDTFVAAADCWKQYREYRFYKESGLTFFMELIIRDASIGTIDA